MTPRTSASLVWLTALAGLACAVSQPLDDLPPTGAAGSIGAIGSTGGNAAAGASGSAGASGVAGASGGAGTSGSAGTGVSGAAGRGGSNGLAGSGGAGRGGATGAGTAGSFGRGGTTGTAGRAGSGGGVGRGGNTGAAGTLGIAGTSGGGNADGGTATFTEVYTQVISQNCFGSGCHNPAGGNRPSFATQALCYTYFKNQGQLYPGQDPNNSYLYFIMHGDPTASPPSPPYMPPAPNPHVSADDLAIVAAWIAGGALNN